VGADHGRIEDQDIQVGVAHHGGHGGESTGLGPAVEPAPLAVPVAVPLGQVAPWDAGAGHVQDGVDEPAVVLSKAAMLARLAGKQTLDAVPVGIGNLVATTHGGPSMAKNEGRHVPELPTCCPHGLGRVDNS
jgi:hypothetical protein